MSDTTKEAEYNAWLLSEDLAYRSGIVYIHSSTRNFNKALKQSGLAQIILETLKPLTTALNTNLKHIKQQLNPSKLPKPMKGTRYDILKMFDKNGNSFVMQMDQLKNNIKKILLDPAYIRYNEYLDANKTQTQSINGTEITMMSRINVGGIGYKTVKKSEDIKECADYSSRAIIKLLGLDANGSDAEQIQKKFKNIYEMYGKQGVVQKRAALGSKIAALATQKNTGMTEAEFLAQFNALFQNLKNIVLHSDYQKSYTFFAGLKNMSDLLQKSKQVYTNLGDLYEDATRALLIDNSNTLQLYKTAPVIKGVGTSSANKWNSTDIEMALSDMNGFTTQVGASLKQQQDFTKSVPMTVDELIKLDIDKKIKVSKDAINQYKYFVLNYSILTDYESHKGRQEKDGWLNSLDEFLHVKEALDNFFGKIVFTRALLGPILFNTQHSLQDRSFTKSTSRGDSLAPPFILVTQNYSCFTFDLLTAMETLMKSDAINMQLGSVKYSKTSMHDIESLHNSKKEFIQAKKKEGVLDSQDYDTMMTDSEFDVAYKMASLNRSAFGDEVSNLGIDTVINTSKLMNILQSKIHLR